MDDLMVCDHGKLPGLLSHAAGSVEGGLYKVLQDLGGNGVCGEFPDASPGQDGVHYFIHIHFSFTWKLTGLRASPVHFRFFHYSAELRYKKSENEKMIRGLKLPGKFPVPLGAFQAVVPGGDKTDSHRGYPTFF